MPTQTALREQWRRFVERRPVDPSLRAVVLDLWRRSRAAGVDATAPRLRHVGDDRLARLVVGHADLLGASTMHLEWITRLLPDVPHVVCLTDRDGVVLVSTGNDHTLMKSADLLPGVDCSERAMGTNGAGTAIATNAPLAIVGCEHWTACWHGVTCVGAPVHDADGAVVGAIGLTTRVEAGDPARLTLIAHVALVIERELARLRAERVNVQHEAFLSLLSHELRSHLTTIVGWTRLLHRGGLDGAVQARAIETIDRSARTQARVIDELLDATRMMRGTVVLEAQPVALAPVIERVVAAARPTIEAKSLALRVSCADPCVVSGDAQRLQQIVDHLVGNAVKFTPPSGRIDVCVECERAVARLVVADTGAGIGAEVLPHVFEWFRQGRRASDPSGLGLGLPVVRHLVALHGGDVRVDSPGAGRGTVATVTLPLADAPTS